MNKVIKNYLSQLQERYEIAINSTSDKIFFLNLFDYLKPFFSEAVLKEIVDNNILTKREKDLEKLNKLDSKLREEADNAYKIVKAYVDKNKIDSAGVKSGIETYEGLLAGTHQMSGVLSTNLAGQVNYILISISEIGTHKDFLKTMGIYDKDERYIERWTYAPVRDELDEERNKLKRLQETTTWHQWEKLNDFYLLFLNYEQMFADYKNKKQFLSIMGLSFAIQEIKQIMETGSAPKDRVRFFDMDEYKQALRKFHTDLKFLLLGLEEKLKKGVKQLPSKRFEVKNLFSLSQFPLGIYYEGQSKIKREWIYPEGKIQPYAVLMLAYEKHKRKDGNFIKLSYKEIEDYINDSKNCDRPPNWKAVVSYKRRLEHLRKNMIRLTPFTKNELRVEEGNNTAYLIFQIISA